MNNSKPYRLDLTGQKFGRLKVIQFAENKNHITYWLCKCDCGNEAVVRTTLLRSGLTRSCGCLSKERTASMGRANRKHKCTDRKLLGVWRTMLFRCENEKSNRYKVYGGRGIKVCDEWHDIDKFTDWAEQNGYRHGLTIDRIDVNGMYCPDNCRFVTYREQANNKNSNRILEFNGVQKTVTEWARQYGIKQATLSYRINHGWSIEKALTEPVKKKGEKHGHSRPDNGRNRERKNLLH